MTRETSIALRVGVPVVAAGAVLLVAAWLARSPAAHAPPPPPAPPQEIGCILPQADRVQVETYDKLAICLDQWNANRPVGAKAVSVADVRHWVEVERDPIWLDKQMWWLPLSGEGDEHFASGIYMGVPTDGTVCNFSIVN